MAWNYWALGYAESDEEKKEVIRGLLFMIVQSLREDLRDLSKIHEALMKLNPSLANNIYVACTYINDAIKEIDQVRGRLV